MKRTKSMRAPALIGLLALCSIMGRFFTLPGTVPVDETVNSYRVNLTKLKLSPHPTFRLRQRVQTAGLLSGKEFMQDPRAGAFYGKDSYSSFTVHEGIIRSISGPSLFANGTRVVVAGDSFDKLVRYVGYPHEMKNTTSGASLTYFIDDGHDGSVLEVEAAGSSPRVLRIQWFRLKSKRPDKPHG